MSRVGAIAALSLTAVLIVVAAVVWNTASHRSGAPSGPGGAVLADAAAADGENDSVTLVRQAGGAIRARDNVALARYLTKGIDPNALDGEGETLLNKAVLHGTPAMVEMLLAAGADPDLPGKNGLGPLAIAALAGHHQMLERLVEASNARRAAAGLPAIADAEAPAPVAAEAAPVEPAPPVIAPPEDATPPHAAQELTRAGAAATGDSAADQPVPAGDGIAEIGGDRLETAAIAAPPPAFDTGAPAPETQGGAALATIFPPPLARAPREQARLEPPSASNRGGDVGAPPAVAPPPPPETAVEPDPGGAPRNWVLAAQKRLAQLGYYKGTPDGVAGSETVAAIRTYQTVAGIAVNGLVSAALLRRIGATVEAPQPAANPAAAYRPPASGSAPQARSEEAEAQALRNVLNKFQTDLGQNFNSQTRPDVMRRYCLQNANTWVYDEATQRSVYCRDLVGLAPR